MAQANAVQAIVAQHPEFKDYLATIFRPNQLSVNLGGIMAGTLPLCRKVRAGPLFPLHVFSLIKTAIF